MENKKELNKEEFIKQCNNFSYDNYLSADDQKYYGTPKNYDDIPYGNIYGSRALFCDNIIGMHQTITEKKLWDNLELSKLKLFSPKIEYVGHSGSTFHVTYYMMKQIKNMGWDSWIEALKNAEMEEKNN